MGAISRYARLPSDLIALHTIGPEIQRVKRKISEIFDSANRLKINLDTSDVEKVHIEDEYPQDYGTVHQNFEDIDLVGFGDEHKEIVGKLVDKEDITLSVVSIVAMGGAGNTTLARKVYTSSSVKQHFEEAYRVNVYQTLKGIDLLNDFMKQIMGGKDE